jgi:phosphohistidine phosphatase
MPDILIFRHGIAEDLREAEGEGRDERGRRLTEEGVARTGEVCRGLREILPRLQRILTSPLARAVQTAELLQQAFGSAELESCEALVQGSDLRAVCGMLGRGDGHTIAVVGHEPDLGELCGLLLTGEASGIVDLKKAGSVLIHSDEPGSGDGVLHWMLPPRVARRIGSR